jgi:putative heme-binding domain-containing protein
MVPAQTNPFAGNSKEIDVGRGLFRIRCAPCHGIKAQGGRGPDLTVGAFNNGGKDSDLYRVISDGVPGTEMPSYGPQIGDENVWRLIAYIRSVSTGSPPRIQGSKAAGERLFWGKGGCAACHRVGLRGGRMGPDLTRVGRVRSVAYLRASLIDPNADLTPGFYKITATTSDGRKVSGVQRSFANFSCQFMDQNETIHSFERSERTSCEREYVSVMPSYKSFTSAEQDDMLSYLVTLRGEQQ